MDTGCYGTEWSWPLLSTQYAEQGLQRPCLRDMRNIHRRCTHTVQNRPRLPHQHMFEHLRARKVADNPRKTKLGLKEVEYIGHLVSATGCTSFTPEKRLKILDFPQPSTQKEMLQFIGLATDFRDNVPNMTEMVKPLRDMIPQGKYQRTGKLVWATESSAAFQLCQQAISNCQILYFLEDTATPVLQTDTSKPLWYWWLPQHGNQW